MRICLTCLAFLLWLVLCSFWLICAIGGQCVDGITFSAFWPLDAQSPLLGLAMLLGGAFLLGGLTVFLEHKPSLESRVSSKAKSPRTKKYSVDITDLTLINGIGPTTAAQLRQMGITTLENVVHLSIQDAAKVTHALGFDAKLIDRDDWRGQARALLHK